MSTVSTGVDYTLQTTLRADLIDTDTENIRTVIDGDSGFGIDSVNLNAAPGFRVHQQAEPANRILINVPIPDIVSSTTELAPFSQRVYAVVPVNGRLARASIAWRNIAVANGNTYIAFQVQIAGFPFFPTAFAYRDGPNPKGIQVLQTNDDIKFLEAIGRPSVYAMQPIPIDLLWDFDGDTFTLEGMRLQIEFNLEHVP